MSAPHTHPGRLSAKITLSLWFASLYIIGIAVISGKTVLAFLSLLTFRSTDNHDPVSVTGFLPNNIVDVLNSTMLTLVGVIFLLLLIILPLQLPGWLVIRATVDKLRSLPRDMRPPSLAILQGIARAAVVAYLWAILGLGIGSLGFSIQLASLNPRFTFGIAGIDGALPVIGRGLWLLTILVFAQLPGWMGLWYCNKSSLPLPIPDNPQWQRWRQKAAIYLWVSPIITLIGYWIIMRYHEVMASMYELDTGFAFFNLFKDVLMIVVYLPPALLLAQLPGWLMMGWLERQRWQAAGMIKQPISRLQLLHGVAVGYLAAIIGASIMWWNRLEGLNYYDVRGIFVSRLPPVLDALFWAQIPGWMALLLWAGLWLKKRARRRTAS